MRHKEHTLRKLEAQSNKLEVEGSILLAHDYLKTDPSGRGIEIPIYKVKQGNEPPNFTGFFSLWEPNVFKVII